MGKACAIRVGIRELMGCLNSASFIETGLALFLLPLKKAASGQVLETELSVDQALVVLLCPLSPPVQLQGTARSVEQTSRSLAELQHHAVGPSGVPCPLWVTPAFPNPPSQTSVRVSLFV